MNYYYLHILTVNSTQLPDYSKAWFILAAPQPQLNKNMFYVRLQSESAVRIFIASVPQSVRIRTALAVSGVRRVKGVQTPPPPTREKLL